MYSLSTMLSVAYEGGDFLQTIQRSQYNLPPVNVAFGLSGNHPGFLAEFEVALKSVLLNAPMERNLYVHVLADKDAFSSLGEIFNRTLLPTWVTRNPIEIHAYDISSHLPWLKQTIHDTFSTALNRTNFNVNEATDRHTIGCFYRLMVHRIIPLFVKHVLYLDTDVVVFANEEDLWQQVESKPDALFHWGQNMCSGFVVMNLQRMGELWSLAKSVTNMTDISEERKQDVNDQLLYLALNVTYPEEVNVLPDGWDMTVASIWQKEYWPYNESRPNVGMLHFNGGSSSKHSYFRGHDFLGPGFNDTWGKPSVNPAVLFHHYLEPCIFLQALFFALFAHFL